MQTRKNDLRKAALPPRRVSNLSLTAAIAAAICAAPVYSAPPTHKEGHILVQPRAGLPSAEFDSILQRKGGKAVGRLRALNIHVVEVPAQAEEAVARALAKNPHIKFAEKDMLVGATEIYPSDPDYSSAWHLPKIEAPLAWEFATAEGITIAILDSGVETSHPDLADQIVTGWNSINRNSIDIDDINGHGTKAAGIAAATTDNAIGVSAIGWGASIMPVRITNRSDAYAYYSDIASGLTWASDNGADIANISYNVTSSSSVTSAAQYMRNSGGVVLVAAGNDGSDPGWSDNPSIISVSATTSSDSKASWSNFGDYIDIAAPGSGIKTTARGGGYSSVSGTSFSSPTAAGLTALIMAANPGLTPDEVESVLESSADDPVSGSDWHAYYGYGRINAAAAVAMAMDLDGTPVDSTSPAVDILSPTTDSMVYGLVPVEVDASDDTGVTEVMLYAGNTLVGTDDTVPYQFTWDSSPSIGTYETLVAYGYDAAGNEGVSEQVTVLVDSLNLPTDETPPTVSIGNPTNGSTVSRTVRINVSAADDRALDTVSLYIDGNLKASSSSGALSYDWNTRKENSGNHSIEAIARDAAGNSSNNSISVDIGSASTGGGSKGKGNKKK